MAPCGNIENLRKQAKKLLKQAKEGSPHALSRLARARIAKDTIKLADAQTTIARENGTSSWTELITKLESKADPDVKLPSISIKQIDQIWLDCLDIGEAESFYTKTLNLEKVAEVPNQMIFFDCGDTRLLLGKRNKIRPNSIIYFEIGESEQSI